MCSSMTICLFARTYFALTPCNTRAQFYSKTLTTEGNIFTSNSAAIGGGAYTALQVESISINSASFFNNSVFPGTIKPPASSVNVLNGTGGTECARCLLHTNICACTCRVHKASGCCLSTTSPIVDLLSLSSHRADKCSQTKPALCAGNGGAVQLDTFQSASIKGCSFTSNSARAPLDSGNHRHHPLLEIVLAAVHLERHAHLLS